ncbi:MAG TPA: hypothetical protein VGP25_20890 [Gemmatimonadaceae bacterium]|nr:hypothetical protein [Gemmatimonadaceae bacterium]
MRRPIIALLLVLAALPVHSGGAQIIRGGGRFTMKDPQLWVSGSVGWQQGWTVVDGTTGTRWDLSDATSYGASIERTLTGGTTLALRGSTARVPINYVQAQLGGSSVQADANVSQAFLGIHVSSGRDFHSVLELGAGATIYSGFRERDGGQQLRPSKADVDFAFAFGYGLGYSLSRSFQIDVVQDLATTLHQKAGLAAGESSSSRVSGTRLVARYGFGS